MMIELRPYTPYPEPCQDLITVSFHVRSPAMQIKINEYQQLRMLHLNNRLSHHGYSRAEELRKEIRIYIRRTIRLFQLPCEEYIWEAV